MNNQQILNEIIIQILGFFVVFWVLKRLAWTKVLGVIDARRKTIADTFEDLEKKKKALEDLESEYRAKLEHIEEEARAKILEAAKAGAILARDIQDKARVDAQKLVDRAQAEIEQDLVKARLTLRDQVVDLSALMAEKIIRAKLTAAEHKRLVDEFIKDIEKVS